MRSTVHVAIRIGFFIALPCLIYIFAITTQLGPILFIFPGKRDAGIHTGDTIAVALLTPIWLHIGWDLWRHRTRI
jgi:hypothetical protein